MHRRLPLQIRLVPNWSPRRSSRSSAPNVTRRLTFRRVEQFGCFNIFLAIVQLILFIRMFRNPMVNPPPLPVESNPFPNQPLLARNPRPADLSSSEDLTEGEEEDFRVGVAAMSLEQFSSGDEMGRGDGRMRFGGERAGARGIEAYQLGRMDGVGRNRSRGGLRG